MLSLRIVTWNTRELDSSGDINSNQIFQELKMADVILLQEAQFAHRHFLDSISFIEHWAIEPSLQHSGLQMGPAILSPHRIENVTRVRFADPGWEIKAGTERLLSHPKGLLCANICTRFGNVVVGSTHLLPAALFEIAEGSKMHRQYIDSVVRTISESNIPIELLGGDFNIEDRSPLTTQLGLNSSTTEMVTRTNGKSHDDVLFSDSFSCVDRRIVPTSSDHSLVRVTLNK